MDHSAERGGSVQKEVSSSQSAHAGPLGSYMGGTVLRPKQRPACPACGCCLSSFNPFCFLIQHRDPMGRAGAVPGSEQEAHVPAQTPESSHQCNAESSSLRKTGVEIPTKATEPWQGSSRGHPCAPRAQPLKACEYSRDVRWGPSIGL